MPWKANCPDANKSIAKDQLCDLYILGLAIGKEKNESANLRIWVRCG